MRFCFALITLMIVSSTASSQSRALADTLQAMERDSWRAWQTHNGEFFERFLSDDHVEVGAFGIAGKATVVKGVAGGACKVISYSVDQFRTTRLVPDAVLLTYHAAQNTMCGTTRVPSPVWVSSLFVNRNRRWLNAAYQQTPDLTRQVGIADTVIESYFTAIGGYRALKGVTTRRMSGTYVEGPLRATTEIFWERPALRRVNVHAPGFDYSEGFDGQTWEYNHDSKKAVIDTGAQAAAGRRGAEFDESFLDYREKGNRVDFVGRESLAGAPVIHVRVTMADGFVKDYYFDARTHLIAAVGKAMPIHAVGAPVKTLSYYEDWRQEGGLLQPHSFVEREVQTGRVLNALHWDRIESNAPIRRDEITNPAR